MSAHLRQCSLRRWVVVDEGQPFVTKLRADERAHDEIQAGIAITAHRLAVLRCRRFPVARSVPRWRHRTHRRRREAAPLRDRSVAQRYRNDVSAGSIVLMSRSTSDISE